MASIAGKCKYHEYLICVWEYKCEHYETHTNTHEDVLMT